MALVTILNEKAFFRRHERISTLIAEGKEICAITQLRKVHKILEKLGIPPECNNVSNQILKSLKSLKKFIRRTNHITNNESELYNLLDLLNELYRKLKSSTNYKTRKAHIN